METTKLHILMLSDAWFPFFGGGQVHVRELSKALKKLNITTTVFYPKKTALWYRLLWSFTVPIQIAFYSRNNKVDILHSHGYNSGLGARLSSWLISKPCIHTVHGSNLLDLKNSSFKGKLETFLLTRIRYDAQITVSRSFLQHPNVNTNISCIPNGVDLETFDQVSVLKNFEPTIIWVGRNQPVKGLRYLKAAYKKVQKKFPDAKLEVITGGKVTGNDLIKKYKQASVFVLPSLSEGQPITLLEAWASQLPVVVTAVGENPYMVVDGENGFLVEPKSSLQLEGKINYLLSHPLKASKMGTAGYYLVKEKYTWQNVAMQTRKVYESVINLR